MKKIQIIFLCFVLMLVLNSCAHNSRTKEEDCFSVIGKGDIKKLERLINKKPELVNIFDKEGYTLLHCSAREGKEEMAQLLISRGADINAKNKDGNAPLFLAISGRNEKMTSLLMKNGADVNAANKEGWTPLFCAIYCRDKAILNMLISNGASVNVTNKEGVTPLHYAKWKGYGEIVELLQKYSKK